MTRKPTPRTRYPKWLAPLRKAGACKEAVKWCRKYATIDEAWRKCRNYLWMDWYIAMTRPHPCLVMARNAALAVHRLRHWTMEAEDLCDLVRLMYPTPPPWPSTPPDWKGKLEPRDG